MNISSAMTENAVSVSGSAKKSTDAGEAAKSSSKPSNSNKTTAVEAVQDKIEITSSSSIEQLQRLLEQEIGKKLDRMLEKAGLSKSETNSLDYFSPEATAGRIFDFSTGLLDVFKAQNNNLTEADQIDRFEEVIRSSVQAGAAQALNLFRSAGVDENNLSIAEEAARQTLEILNQKYDLFFERMRTREESSN